MGPSDEAWKKRQALHLAAQLPENPQDALAVLDHARDLVTRFLLAGVPVEAAPVAPFRARASSNVRAISSVRPRVSPR